MDQEPPSCSLFHLGLRNHLAGVFLVYFIFPGNQLVEVLCSQAVFSPALAAMFIPGIAEPHPMYARRSARWFTFAGSWLAASIVQILYFWKIYEIELLAAIVVISCIFALFPAWVLSSAYARCPGIRKHFSTLLKPRGPALWYAVVFFIFPGIPLLAMGITRHFGGKLSSPWTTWVSEVRQSFSCSNIYVAFL